MKPKTKRFLKRNEVRKAIYQRSRDKKLKYLRRIAK